MDGENRIPTKKELKQLRKLERLDRDKAGARQNTVKWIVIGVASLLFLAFFTFLVVVSKESSKQATTVKLSSQGWVRGEKTAKVTLTEFSDLQCPACKAYEPIVEQAMKDLNGKLKLVYKHFPLPAHKNGLAAAKAAEAAGVQGKFWEMHDLLFQKQEEWGVLDAGSVSDKFVAYAAGLKLDQDKFKSDLNDSSLEAKIKAEQSEGIDLGVNSTPTFYINNQLVQSAPQSYPEFKKLIDQYIK